MSYFDSALQKSLDKVPILTGPDDFKEWDRQLERALVMCRAEGFISNTASLPHPATVTSSAGLPLLTELEQQANIEWNIRDKLVANGISGTLGRTISANFDRYLKLPMCRSKAIYAAIVEKHGAAGVQYTFSVARRFLARQCGEGEDVRTFLRDAQSDYLELDNLSFDLKALHLNIILNGLPTRFNSFKDSIWKATYTPAIDDIEQSIIRIDAGHREQTSMAALASQSMDGYSNELGELRALYAKMRRAGGTPSEQHPCLRCKSPKHWIVDCPEPATEGEHRSKNRRFKKKGQGRTGDNSNMAVTNTVETAAFASNIAAPPPNNHRPSSIYCSLATTSMHWQPVPATG
nr:uncharacterized protein CI109_005312 [Kwoniella shandongensis]KAA5526355.1 hypothetical protein CI109_005312 [Kwoniella shandongensis]